LLVLEPVRGEFARQLPEAAGTKRFLWGVTVLPLVAAGTWHSSSCTAVRRSSWIVVAAGGHAADNSQPVSSSRPSL
jgi:hypothetical protein